MNTITQFSDQVVVAGGRFASVSDLSQVREYVFKLASDLGAKQVVVSDHALYSALMGEGRTGPFAISSRNEMRPEDFYTALKTAEIGVSPVDLAIAETGTLVLTTRDETDRLVTALPTIHVAVVRSSQVVDSLEEAALYIGQTLAQIPEGVAISLISGSSKTSDVGGILISGVHGPKELHVLLLSQEPARSV